MKQLGYAKNTQALIDIIGCFDVKLIGDIFAGSGTTALAAFELDYDCVLVEREQKLCEQIQKQFKFFGIEAVK
jgi:DNA modification methylase